MAKQGTDPRPAVENDAAVVDALKAITGVETIRSHTDYDPETNEPRHRPGYRKHAGGFVDAEGKAAPMYAFVNERGQPHQVPAHRVAEALKAPKAPAKGE